uniref:Uncharacterized protein n=1 Tax=Zooxanthella nutricula TaxID=1333877 RepID=A0A7S2VGW6_9DINO
MVLHQRGKRLAKCPLAGHSEFVPGRPELSEAWNISAKWLRYFGLHGRREAVISAAVDGPCKVAELADSRESCMVVGTDHGRIVRLRQHLAGEPELVPASVLWNVLGKEVEKQSKWPAIWATSALHSLHGVCLALRDEHRNLYAFDMVTRRMLGRWRLPHHPGRTWNALAGGATHVFITSQDEVGSAPQLWRFSLPNVVAHLFQTRGQARPRGLEARA